MRKRLRLFQGHTDRPTQDGVGAALQEIFDVDDAAEAEMQRLVEQLKKIERPEGGQQ